MATNTEEIGKLMLRLSVGGLMLPHGIAKIFRGVEGIATRFADAGLPGQLAYLVYLGEVVAPVLMIVGFWSRVGAALVAGTMVVAVWLAHMDDVFALTRGGGWGVELQALFFFGAVASALLGPGRYGLSRGRGRL
jgi:putative oxidoreductase